MLETNSLEGLQVCLKWLPKAYKGYKCASPYWLEGSKGPIFCQHFLAVVPCSLQRSEMWLQKQNISL